MGIFLVEWHTTVYRKGISPGRWLGSVTVRTQDLQSRGSTRGWVAIKWLLLG